MVYFLGKRKKKKNSLVKRKNFFLFFFFFHFLTFDKNEELYKIFFCLLNILVACSFIAYIYILCIILFLFFLGDVLYPLNYIILPYFIPI